MIEVKIYKTEQGVEPFTVYLKGIKDPIAKSAVLEAINRIEKGLPGQVRALGDGLKERKIKVGAGHRIYFYNDGQELVVLLGGSTKRNQRQQIESAKTCLSDYKRQKRARKRLEKKSQGENK